MVALTYTPVAAAPPAEQLLFSISDVSRLIAVGERTIWRWMSEAKFPPPDIFIGSRVRRWKRETIEAWIVANSATTGAQ